MDHGFGIHVVNNIMKQCFEKEKDCTHGSTIMSDKKPLLIKAYGRMTIKVDTSIERDIMILLNVAYISDFMTNIVADSILDDKGLHFDTKHRHLHRNDSTVVLVLRIGAHYVLENNRKESEGVAAFATSIRAGSTHDRHQLLAHVKATIAEGVKLTDKESVSIKIYTHSSKAQAIETSLTSSPTPPTTPPKTWAVVASKPASTASPLQTPLQPRQKRIQKPLKRYLTVDDLYRMFHVKQPPQQTRITSFFKSMIKPVMRKSKRNTLPITKNVAKPIAPSLASPAALKREIPSSTPRKSMDWSFKRYVSDLPLKTTPEKRSGNILYTAPPTLKQRQLLHAPISMAKHQKGWRSPLQKSNTYTS